MDKAFGERLEVARSVITSHRETKKIASTLLRSLALLDLARQVEGTSTYSKKVVGILRRLLDHPVPEDPSGWKEYLEEEVDPVLEERFQRVWSSRPPVPPGSYLLIHAGEILGHYSGKREFKVKVLRQESSPSGPVGTLTMVFVSRPGSVELPRLSKGKSGWMGLAKAIYGATTVGALDLDLVLNSVPSDGVDYLVKEHLLLSIKLLLSPEVYGSVLLTSYLMSYQPAVEESNSTPKEFFRNLILGITSKEPSSAFLEDLVRNSGASRRELSDERLDQPPVRGVVREVKRYYGSSEPYLIVDLDRMMASLPEDLVL